MRRILILSILIFSLTGCGNGNYKLSDNSELNKEDLKILQKSFNQLEQDEKTRLITMESDMTDEEREIFKEDLKRLYIEEMGTIYSSPEQAAKVFEENWDLENRKRKGELTEEEKDKEEHYEKVAEETVEKSNEFFQAKENLQKIFNDKSQQDNKVMKVEVVDYSPYRESFDIKLKVKPFKEIKVFEINNLRNEIVDEVRNVIETKQIKIELYMGEEHKDTYIFNNGWDKQVTP